MGKFNWKRAIAGGSEYIRGQNEEKRAYERQDREAAIALAIKYGLPLPSDIQRDSPMMAQMLAGKSLPELDMQMQEKEWRKKAEIEAEYKEPEKPAEWKQKLAMFLGTDTSIIDQMPPKEQMKAYREFRQFESQAGQDPRMQELLELNRIQSLQTGNLQQQIAGWQLKMKPLEAEKEQLAVDKAKTEALKVKKPQDAFNYMADSIEGTYETWRNIPKELKGKYKNAWYEAQKTANVEALANEPTYGPYTISRDALAIDLATAWEPTQGGGVQRLSDQDIKRYTDMNVTLATEDDKAAWNKKEQLKKVVARKMGVTYEMKPYPAGNKSNASSVNKKKAELYEINKKLGIVE